MNPTRVTSPITMFTHTEIKPNVDLFTEEGKEIYVVGTAHISSQSVDLVQETIDEILPETVAVELCDGRLKSLKDPDRWKNTNLVTIIRQGKAHILLAQLLLAGYQKKLGKMWPRCRLIKTFFVNKSFIPKIG